MSDVRIECPHCHKSFKLTETLAAPFVEESRRKMQELLDEKEAELAGRRRAVADEEKAVDKARKAMEKEKERLDDEIARQVKERSGEIAKEEAKRAKQRYEDKAQQTAEQLKDLSEALEEKGRKLSDALKTETELRKKQRALDDKLREADLAIEKRVAELVGPEREKARKEAEEAARLKSAEKDKLIEAQKLQLAEAQRRLEQGSQQLQGEVQELELERLLRQAFPRDTIQPVPKGHHGGDILHRVLGTQGQASGTVLWEAKRTKNWSNGWIDKLKQDQRAAKAEVAVLVTHALPPGIEQFGLMDGVWVATPLLAVPLAVALRAGLLETSMARTAAQGQQEKTALLYHYLTGPRFRQRVEAIQDAFIAMKADLEAEKRLLNKQWAKREQQLDRVMMATVGMYGDFQAVAGTSLAEIDGLELEALPAAGEATGSER